MDTAKELTHLSLCTGYGGIDLGLKRALGALRTIAYVEIEAFPIVNLVKKMEADLLDSAPIFTDLKRFPWGIYHHKVDILSGGFPCQPFSAAGRRAGDEDPRHLWPYIVRGIRELGRPPLVFFENVEGIISSKLKGDSWRDPEGTPVLLHVLKELERLGYNPTAGVFSAAEVGAPHQRKRMFILGVRDDLRQSGFDLINAMFRDGVKTAYPKGRGADQHLWEPPRVTLGHSNGRVKKSHGEQCRVLQEAREKGETDRPTRTNTLAEVDNTYSQRSFRDKNNQTICDTQRRKTPLGYNAETDPSSRGLQRETEPPVGRDIDGSSYWLDYAELYESYDNRTDELRMLGNGVVPDTAARAFRVLFNRLSKSHV